MAQSKKQTIPFYCGFYAIRLSFSQFYFAHKIYVKFSFS